jgi:hypothetical protein
MAWGTRRIKHGEYDLEAAKLRIKVSECLSLPAASVSGGGMQNRARAKR